jgi:carboxypeptidase Q
VAARTPALPVEAWPGTLAARRSGPRPEACGPVEVEVEVEVVLEEANVTRSWTCLVVAVLVLAPATRVAAQAMVAAPVDAVVGAIVEEGMERSRVAELSQVLMDSVGPRLTGTPEKQASHDWLVGLYRSWGVEAENEQYGTWRGWQRGPTHVYLSAPRFRELDARLVGWSPGTNGMVEGAVLSLPPMGDAAALERWRRDVAGAFVLASFPEPSCRPLDQWEALAEPQVLESFAVQRAAAEREWQMRLAGLGIAPGDLTRWLAEAGAAGIFTSAWSGGYGAQRIFGDREGLLPTMTVSCEDYGLLHRLADRAQGPRVRVDARADMLGTVPAFNTIATIRGTERPDEYIVLSAHLDSWDGADGATDNGSGTIVMLEAMRLLRTAYPNPKRTIIAGHWGSEEQGLNGSRAFAVDRPEVVRGMQALFNQDNGTGPVARVGMQGLSAAEAHFRRWLEPVPDPIARRIQIDAPGLPATGGTDHASFTCEGAPAFGLSSEPWDYFRYTWHTNLDTLDKLAFDNIRDNAILVAILTFMASEDPEFMSRDRRAMPVNERTGQQLSWPRCHQPMRSWEDYGR